MLDTPQNQQYLTFSQPGKRKIALEKELERWIPLLIEHYKPEKIILFGSLVNNDLREWSDIDLVVITRSDLPFMKRIRNALLLLQPKVGVDLLIYTPDEFEELQQQRKFVREEVVEKGKVVYERSP